MIYAEVLFDQLCDERAIKKYASEFPAEKLHLDFKAFPLGGEPQDAGEKKHELAFMEDKLGKVLSGFANADGGVLVLGVKETNKKTRPRATSPIAAYKYFDQRLNEELSRRVDPPVDGVRTKTVDATDGKGYVVVLIPPSDQAPHRHRSDREYYRRVGDSFVRMEHYEIADAFGRRHRPALEFYIKFYLPTPSFVYYEIGLKNVGRTLAKFPFVEVELVADDWSLEAEPEVILEEDGGRFGLRRMTSPEMLGPAAFSGDASTVIHAGMSMPFGIIEGPAYSDKGLAGQADERAFWVSVSMAAEGLAAKTVSAAITWGQLSAEIWLEPGPGRP